MAIPTTPKILDALGNPPEGDPSRVQAATIVKLAAEAVVTLPPWKESDSWATIAARSDELGTRARLLKIALELDPKTLPPVSGEWSRERGWQYKYW